MSSIDLSHIEKWVKPGARVLDLGCGDGSMLAALQDRRRAVGLGVEIDPDKITLCLEKGLCVVQQNLNLGLKNFDNNSFDLVLMTFALQETKAPAEMLEEMVRIGKRVIVSIPNMGYWRCRWHIAARGRMPVVRALPNQWYDSENIHLCTLVDFEQLCHETGIKVLGRSFASGAIPASLMKRWRALSNWFAESAFYLLSA